jgi:hypothetical protein
MGQELVWLRLFYLLPLEIIFKQPKKSKKKESPSVF